MQSSFLAWVKSRFPVLFEEKMPVWLTILASIAAAAATYVLAPTYSHRFQLEDARGARLAQTTDKLNEEIIELSQKERRFDSALANGQKNALALHDDCLDLITKLQWRLVDLQAVLNQPSDREAVDRLSNAIEALRLSLNEPVTPEYRARVRAAMESLANATRIVLDRLYKNAQLQG